MYLITSRAQLHISLLPDWVWGFSSEVVASLSSGWIFTNWRV